MQINSHAELLTALHRRGRPVWIDMPEAARVDLLLHDYAHFTADPEGFCRLLDGLVELRGRARVMAWQAQARAGDWPRVFAALMREHYDPGYAGSLRRHFPALAQGWRQTLVDGGPEHLADAARALIAAG